ncbi:SUMF1/EgtB/PvdO family nonheme iron enzyme [Nostoc punctiforme]|uniref:Sulfatase-modifying factor enzyme domain-containing protein n=1 Tax=Nostoc punctiforme (strain ATCC 29133 / PCC 73102) TaxID=63737 RepID=B2JAV5_NOSP7|nr:SUMF1/EgtB/PvdO family nonheme iron enzyme [Nostoc punctiforme]ACC85059.1 protein of unknown function DUF323 [Nostoc punctiforme PCC 73102]
MVQDISQKFTLWLKVSLLGLSLPLLLSSSIRAEECTPADIKAQIEKFKDAKTFKAANDTVVKCGEDAISSLAEALSNSDAATRTNAASALGKMGWIAQDAVPDIVETLGDGDENVRSSSVRALIAIGRSAQQQANTISELDLKGITKLQLIKRQIEKALAHLDAKPKEWANQKLLQQELRLTRNALQTKLNQLQDRIISRFIQWVIKNPGIFILLAVAAYLSIFSIRPLWLLSLNKVLPQTWKIPIINQEIAVKWLLFLNYKPRVLDTWVEKYIEPVKTEFLLKDIVKRDSGSHIPQPVEFKDKIKYPQLKNNDNSTEEALEHKELQKELKAEMQREQQFCVLIEGEGGAGKTSLACQIANWGIEGKLANHRILPVLIDRDLQDNEDLLQMIRKQLQDLTNTGNDDITQEFLIHLLYQRRVLVIIDHFSEMEKSTRNKILAAITENPIINALVFTSRVVGELKGLTRSTLKPMRVEGERISEFLGEYLKLCNYRNQFDDEAFYNACSRLNRMVGQRKITIMLAKLYADQMIATKYKAVDTELPENIPDLMLSYLNQLHPKAGSAQQLTVHQDLEIIAWKCLENTYSPTPISRITAEEALVRPGSNEIDSRLDYLQTTLNILLKIEPDKVKINLDPLAEYLAGLYLVQQYKDNAEAWQKLLNDIDEKSENLEKIKGFLLALWDCCEFKKNEFKIPDLVFQGLLKRANLDPKEIEAEQRKRRIKILINELYTPEVEFRIRAVIDLQTMGKDANPAIPRLRKLLENNSEIAKVRREVAKTLKQLGQQNRMIILQIDNGVESIRLAEHPPTEEIYLGDKVILEMVRIQGGTFLMGAPETEEYSMDSERPQHEVTVLPFFIGKYPVTQVQWLAVTSLPQVNRELDPDPSRFKGANLPIEKVSWYEAVEFCDRLSQHTGKTYRLPSEAEWEYACRAGTTTSFHFGETITSELANYDTSEVSGVGVKGRHQKETTPVGNFEVANAFGLYDMHGNVWEWCLDDWHDNYEGAPIDGSAWFNIYHKQAHFVLRGGSWYNNPKFCRSAYRSNNNDRGNHGNITGFRIVCEIKRIL